MNLQVNFYRKIKTLSKKWNSNLQLFLDSFSGQEVLIILFGSRSRNEHNLLSDYDIVMITEKTIEKPIMDFPCDLFVYTLTEAIELLKQDNFILKNALLNGQILIDNIKKSSELQSLVSD